jgi:hypothetical protein
MQLQQLTQGGPLSAKLFNILVDAIAREWMQELQEGSVLEPDEINCLMATFFASVYVDDAFLASCNPEFFQRALNILVNLFACVGLETIVQKTQTMMCTPGRISIQLQKDSYAWMRGGTILAGEWDSQMVICCQFNALVKASSLRSHLADHHNTHPVVVVPADYLEPRACVTY